MITFKALILVTSALLSSTESKCAYKVLDDGRPQKVEGE